METIYLEGEPPTRNIKGVMPSQSFKFYHKKNMFHGPFDLPTALWLCSFGILIQPNSRGEKAVGRSGYFVEVKQTVVRD